MNPFDRLTRCFSEIREELLAFLKRRAGPQAAEDILQEVWVNLRERGNPEVWREPRAVLFTTAAHLATDLSRRSALEHKLFSQEHDGFEAAAPTAGPEAEIETVSQLDRLAAALEELPPACRDAFLLSRLENLTHAQIARRLDVSTKSVQRYIERALRHCLEVAE